MNVKLAVVLLALVAASQAYVVINTWADENCNTTLVAKFITNDNYACAKRAISQKSGCDVNESIGAYYAIDYSFCGQGVEEPTFPTDWQFVKAVEGVSTCNFTDSYIAVGAPESLANEFVVIYTSNGVAVTNTTLSCANTGVITFSSCSDYLGNQVCSTFASLENNVCTADSLDSYYAIQTSCVAVPVSEPVAAPTAGPTSGPVAAPVQAPVRAPSKTPTKASAASSIVLGSAAFLSVIALF
jgi:hypothetical protein